jgi:microcystin-dependent protein
MSEPFVAEIKMFGGNFAPRNYAFCAGQLLPIAQHTALFSLIGTTYGGDGRTTTALPNLQGRMPMHPGNGPGLSSRSLGEVSGAETVTLSEAQMSAHTHPAMANKGTANKAAPGGVYLGKGHASYTGTPGNTGAEAAASQGGSQAHTNESPYLVVTFIIALVGLYPSRS